MGQESNTSPATKRGSSEIHISHSNVSRTTISPNEITESTEQNTTTIQVTGNAAEIMVQNLFTGDSNHLSDDAEIQAEPLSHEQTSPLIATLLVDDKQKEKLNVLFNQAKTENWSKTALVKEIATLVVAGACAIIPADGSYECGKSSAAEVLAFFNASENTFLQVIYGDLTGPIAGIANFFLYANNNRAFINFIFGDNVKILKPSEAGFKVGLSWLLGCSAGLAAVSVAGVNALGETDWPKWRQTLSFTATTAFNIPLHIMFAMNALLRTLLPFQHAEYSRLLQSLSTKLLSYSPAEQVALLKIVLANSDHEACLDALNATNTSDVVKLKICFNYFKKLPTKEMFSIGNDLMVKLGIQPESQLKKGTRYVVYVLAAVVGLIACTGNYYSQHTGEEALANAFFDEEISDTIADWTTWFPFIAKILMYVSAQLGIVDTLYKIPYLTKLFYYLPPETKVAVAMPLAIAIWCFAESGTCYMVDTYTALAEILGLDVGQLTLAAGMITFIANWGATVVNTNGFSIFLLNKTISLSNTTLGKALSLCGFNREETRGYNDLSHTANLFSATAMQFFKTKPEAVKEEIQRYFDNAETENLTKVDVQTTYGSTNNV